MAIVVEKYSARALEPVVTILAHAFVTNPLHVSAFGAHQIDQNRSLFRLGLRQMFCGKSVVALANGQIQGYAHFSPSPHCLPAPEILPVAMAPLLRPFGNASAPLPVISKPTSLRTLNFTKSSVSSSNTKKS